jgi:hypothetical protein
MVRVGNMLLYPVISSYGWSATGFGYPKSCANSTADLGSGSYSASAGYFCSKLIDNVSLVISFIFIVIHRST